MSGGRLLSAGQEAFWFLHRLAPGSAAYNVVTAVRIRGDLDLPRLNRAVRAIAERHDLVRSVFTEVDGEPRRLVRDPAVIRLEVREPAGWDRVHEAIEAAGRTPFRLADGEVPWRMILFRRATAEAFLVLVAHHIATDATSQWLLLGDLLDEYQGGGDRRPAQSYDGYVEQERQLLASPERPRLAAFWRDACAGAVPAELPTDRPRPTRQTFEGATCKIALADGTASRVRAAAASIGVGPFCFLLGVFMSLLYRHTGQDDLVVGCSATTRRGRGLRELVGYLVNPIVVRSRFGRDPTFATAARAAQESVANGMRQARYPFPVLVRDLELPRRADRSPLFQITFTMIEASPLVPLSKLLPAATEGAEIEYAGLRLTQLDIPQMEGQFDLSVELRQRAGGMAAVFRYSTDLFDAATIERLACHYARLTGIAVDDPGARIAEVPMLDEAELGQLLMFGAGG